MAQIVIADVAAHWSEVREEYPAFNNMTYLDTSSCGLVASSTAEVALVEQARLMEEASTRYLWWREEGMAQVRRTVAENIGGLEKGVALVSSFTVGMAQLAQLLVHRPKVLLVAKDYPTLHAPFKHMGFQPIIVEPNADGTIPMELLADAMMRERPQLVAISHVQWTTGHLVDLAAVSELCRKYGARSVVDITQSWCVAPVDVAAMGIDIVGASGYKWPLAGFGNGFMHVSETVRAEVKDRSGIDPVVHLIGGHSDPVALVRLEDALARIAILGVDAIAEQVQQVCDHAIDQFDKAGIQVLNGRDPNTRAGIIMIEGGEERLAKLKNANIQAAMRGAGIRIGIHFYNSEADIDLLVEAIKP